MQTPSDGAAKKNGVGLVDRYPDWWPWGAQPRRCSSGGILGLLGPPLSRPPGVHAGLGLARPRRRPAKRKLGGVGSSVAHSRRAVIGHRGSRLPRRFYTFKSSGARGLSGRYSPPNSLCLLLLIAQRPAMVHWVRLVAYCSDPSLAFTSLRSSRTAVGPSFPN